MSRTLVCHASHSPESQTDIALLCDDWATAFFVDGSFVCGVSEKFTESLALTIPIIIKMRARELATNVNKGLTSAPEAAEAFVSFIMTTQSDALPIYRRISWEFRLRKYRMQLMKLQAALARRTLINTLSEYLKLFARSSHVQIRRTVVLHMLSLQCAVAARQPLSRYHAIPDFQGVLVKTPEDSKKKTFSIIKAGPGNHDHYLLGPVRYLNHDCEPNCELRRSGSSEHQIVNVHPLRPIQTGEELTISSGKHYFELFNQECRCRTCNYSWGRDVMPRKARAREQPPRERGAHCQRCDNVMSPREMSDLIVQCQDEQAAVAPFHEFVSPLYVYCTAENQAPQLCEPCTLDLHFGFASYQGGLMKVARPSLSESRKNTASYAAKRVKRKS